MRTSEFKAHIIRPAIDKLMYTLNEPLRQHLSSQPTICSRAQDDRLPHEISRAISEAISQAFETALSMTAEIHAADERVVYDWYLPGSTYDATRMRLGVHSCPANLPDGQVIAVTLLPRVGLRTSDGSSMITASPAIVNVSS